MLMRSRDDVKPATAAQRTIPRALRYYLAAAFMAACMTLGARAQSVGTSIDGRSLESRSGALTNTGAWPGVVVSGR